MFHTVIVDTNILFFSGYDVCFESMIHARSKIVRLYFRSFRTCHSLRGDLGRCEIIKPVAMCPILRQRSREFLYCPRERKKKIFHILRYYATEKREGGKEIFVETRRSSEVMRTISASELSRYYALRETGGERWKA